MLYALIAISIILLIVISIVVAVRTSSLPPTTEWREQDLGEEGEREVADILGETVPGSQYVINGLLFKTERSSCEIDHIYINKYGIWVIETKNRGGTIYGDDSQEEWTQVLGNGNISHTLRNPVKQNDSHIYNLSRFLKAKKAIFHNIVVFLDRADISNITAENVCNASELPYIKTKVTDILLSIKQMENYYNKLLDLKNNSTISKQEHIDNIHDKYC